MNKKRATYIKNILLPCLLFSCITGILTGGLIFLFKVAASFVIGQSEVIFAYVRQNPALIPALLGSAAVLGLLSALVLHLIPDCRGGGIPTSIAILRGLVSFSWLKSIIFVFLSAMLTYFGGIPLGNEGPSVQMGTAVGRGTVKLFGGKNKAWDRYIMTGGACAGFAAATASPMTGIFFAIEEAHRRLSPMLFMVASMTVIAGSATMQSLCSAFNVPYSLFDLHLDTVLPLRYLWAAVIVGLVAGLGAIAFTKLYRVIRKLVRQTLKKVPRFVKIPAIFLLVAAIGLATPAFLGSGHHTVHNLLHGPGVWYMLILVFAVRGLLLMIATNSDITGGLFVPTLAFGAIIGALVGEGLTAAKLLPEAYYPIMVIIGIAAFLGSSSRTPLTAVAFAIEALCGLSNLLPVAIGVTIAFLVIETLGVPAFTDTVIEGKVEAARKGKLSHIVDTHLVVAPGAFIVGKEIRDILFPPTCVILSVHKTEDAVAGSTGISAGDVLHAHYETTDPARTMAELEALLGKQPPDPGRKVHYGDEHHRVPELS